MLLPLLLDGGSSLIPSGSADGKIVVWRLDTLTYYRSFKDADQGIQVRGPREDRPGVAISLTGLLSAYLRPVWCWCVWCVVPGDDPHGPAVLGAERRHGAGMGHAH